MTHSYSKKSSIQKVEACIEAIEDKRIYRFNRCLHEYARRFNDGFLVSVKMPTNDEGQLDLTPMENAAKERERSVEMTDELYRTNPVSATSYANLANTDIVDAAGHLVSEHLPIRCSKGHAADEASGIQKQHERTPIVVDSSAIATIVLMGANDLLESHPAKLIVSSATLLRLRSSIEDQSRFGGQGVLSYVDSHLVFHETSEADKEAWIDRLSFTASQLEQHCQIEDGLPLAQFTPESRNELVEIFGWDLAEAIAIAGHHQGILWTDDTFVAQVASEKTGVGRVWTEIVAQFLQEKNVIPRSRFIELSSKLIECGYWHTKLLPDVALAMAEKSNWDFKTEPFASAIDWLGIASVSAEAISLLAEELLPKIYGSQNLWLDNMAVMAILSSIGKRRDGRRIVRELGRRVGIYCRLDVQTEVRLSEDMDKWLELAG